MKFEMRLWMNKKKNGKMEKRKNEKTENRNGKWKTEEGRPYLSHRDVVCFSSMLTSFATLNFSPPFRIQYLFSSNSSSWHWI